MDTAQPSSNPQSLHVESILRDIDVSGKALFHGRDGARTALITKARSLIAALETPVEAIIWMAWSEPTRLVAVRIAINLGVFDYLAEGKKGVKTKDDIASRVGGDPKLLGRLLKHLASMQVINEVDVDCYECTEVARALTVPQYRDAIPFCAEIAGPVFQKLPDYLAETGYATPTDSMAGPFQYGHDTNLSVWEWRKERPRLDEAGNNHMAGYHSGRPSWMDEGFYPINERLIRGMRRGQDEVAIVDVGGNMGHDLQELKGKQPALPGRFVLQDLPHVIKQIHDPLEGIEPMCHDFFTEQPIKGSRAYYMHSILHDWNDEDSRRILRHLAAAMEKGYSKILINENVVPDLGADWRITSLDLYMMALAASAERTEAEWKELLRSAGLKVVGIWTMDMAVESLIEAVLEEDDTAS